MRSPDASGRRSESFGAEDAKRPDVSVIVPVRGRNDSLRRLLDSTRNQAAPPRIEVVVVDNPEPSNRAWLRKADFPFPIRYTCLRTANRGSARNAGALLARAETLLFTDSDVRFDSGAVTRLAADAAMNPRKLVMAQISFPRRQARTLGTQFFDVASYFKGYRRRYRTAALTFRHFVSCCFAMDRRAFMEIDGFDSNFSTYGYEDVELAIRAERAGLGFELSSATAFHLKQLDPTTVLQRSIELGRSAVTLVDLHPGIEEHLPVGVADTAVGKLHFCPDFDIEALIRQADRLERSWRDAAVTTPLSRRTNVYREAREAYGQIALYGRFTGIRDATAMKLGTTS